MDDQHSLPWFIGGALWIVLFVSYYKAGKFFSDNNLLPEGDILKKDVEGEDGTTKTSINNLSSLSAPESCQDHLTVEIHNGDSCGVEDKAGGNSERLDL